ncbi:C2 and GRAM domain-containing protein [Heracleum sosnowskyi]|uniref:C2 and GRAM domain-containing protein n=1 Tax=Heracleum sosnowskyi TaxID=360622 RepID=A0AAD8N3M6_9APIA|nr:C2 and GRAM domain-containing protein [Heracleum sosnowskyi]
MKLLVRVIEARNIPAMDQNGLSNPYVKVKIGKQKFKSRVVKKCLNPMWCEEFSFKVEDLKGVLKVYVLDEDKFGKDDCVGLLQFPVSQVFDAEGQSLGTNWYSLKPKKEKAKIKQCGEILLTVCFSHSNSSMDLKSLDSNVSGNSLDTQSDFSQVRSLSSQPSSVKLDEVAPPKEEKSQKHIFAEKIAKIFNKNSDAANKNVDAISRTSSKARDLPEVPETANTEVHGEKSEEPSLSSGSYEGMMKTMENRDQRNEMPNILPGGVVLDQHYAIVSSEMNSLLFSPDSTITKSLADVQKTTELQIGPWKPENGGESLKRVITCVKASTKLVKALKTTEEQIYLKADGKSFAVLSSVSTPDAPYGGCFRTEVLFCITPGTELPSGEQSSQLVVSWRMNFLQSTMMKGMIENGAKQGIRDSFEQFATLLAERVNLADVKGIASEKEQALASLQGEPQSDWKLAIQYFCNLTFISTILMGLYVLVHLCLATPNTIQGLEFIGLDLPDSIGELIFSGVLVLQGERFLALISRFMQARVQKGSDHGIKAQGDGWLLTVALLEGNNMATVDSTGLSDPYVVFSCNGKTRSSSIRFQTSDPQWNEIFEFDAMDEPPSVLDVDVYDFDGPFDEATSLGHGEVNFVKTSISELADVWVPLQGKLAQASHSRLHLRIFLNDTRGSNVVKEYLSKMEKEVGKKIKLRSPQTNSAFQKLFNLPPEEFLINDFTCQLKRKLPLQGRLFLSARIIGYHSDLFGRKTRFFFLWEDIENIQVDPPTLSSMGSPIIVMTLRLGRGLDAKHGAKTHDEGRLKFHFQSFVSFNVAHRTIMALWKAKSLTPEQKVRIAEQEAGGKDLQILEDESGSKCLQVADDETDTKGLQSEENGSLFGFGDVCMSVIYCSVLSVPVNSVMELFGGNELEENAMEMAGCLNYSYTPWESEKADVYERQVYFRSKQISQFRGEVKSTQQKSRLSDNDGWVLEEVMTFHGIPLSDYFNVHLKYHIEDDPRGMGCNVKADLGIAWLKGTKQKKRFTKNIFSNMQERLKVMFSIVEKEYASAK